MYWIWFIKINEVMVELVDTNSLGLFDLSIVFVQIEFTLN